MQNKMLILVCFFLTACVSSPQSSDIQTYKEIYEFVKNRPAPTALDKMPTDKKFNYDGYAVKIDPKIALEKIASSIIPFSDQFIKPKSAQQPVHLTVAFGNTGGTVKGTIGSSQLDANIKGNTFEKDDVNAKVRGQFYGDKAQAVTGYLIEKNQNSAAAFGAFHKVK